MGVVQVLGRQEPPEGLKREIHAKARKGSAAGEGREEWSPRVANAKARRSQTSWKAREPAGRRRGPGDQDAGCSEPQLALIAPAPFALLRELPGAWTVPPLCSQGTAFRAFARTLPPNALCLPSPPCLSSCLPAEGQYPPARQAGRQVTLPSARTRRRVVRPSLRLRALRVRLSSADRACASHRRRTVLAQGPLHTRNERRGSAGALT